MRHSKKLLALSSLILLLLSGCANKDAAELGSLIGRTLGKPIGTVATAIDETFRTTGDVVRENPRFQRQQREQQQATPATSSSDEDTFYYRTEVLVKTRGPAQIEEVSLQEAEDVSDFWR